MSHLFTRLATVANDSSVVDAYRNKMRSRMLAAGQDPSDIPEHFDTRRGKRRFLDSRGRRLETGDPSAAQRSAEEMEG